MGGALKVGAPKRRGGTAKRASASQVPARPRSGPGRAPSKPQSLLILHLDAEKLRIDGLHLGDEAAFAAALSEVLLGSEVVVGDATVVAELNALLAAYVVAKRTFDVVVVVAHSNSDVIRVGRDLVLPWDKFAGFLQPLKPRRLLLVACRGGRWDAGESLFAAMPRLRRIFACPVNASRNFGALMLLLVPYVVANRRPKDKHVLCSQVAAIAATGRQLREWRRTTDKGNPESLMFDFLADLADPWARKVPAIVGALLRGRATRPGRLG